MHATEHCREEMPPFSSDRPAHRYACFNPVDGPLVLESQEQVATVAKVLSGAEIVKIEDLVKNFPITRGLFRRKVGDIQAVSGATFTIHDGETFGLVGESGCGKTTIGRMIVGLEESTSGSIVFAGEDVTRFRGKLARESRKDRQMMFQDPYSSLNPRMRVREIIREPLSVQNIGSKAEQNARGSPPLDALGGVACGPPLSPTPCFLSRAWTWHPAPNLELSLAGGCIGHDPNAQCALAVSRTLPPIAGQTGDRIDTLAQIDTGREIPEVVLVEGLDRRIRVRGADLRGQFFREVIFSYGRVDVKEVH